jgi:hypothetical protein
MVLVEDCLELSSHRTDDHLEQYALGRLPAAELAPLEEHLLACSTCREKLVGFEQFSLGMQEALVMDGVIASSRAQPGERFSGVFAAFVATLTAGLRRPVVSMALGFAVLIAAIGIFSQGHTKFAPFASLQLTAMRGEMPFTVPARQFDLTLADGPRQGGPFHVDVVNATGAPIWQGLAESGPQGVRVQLKQRLSQGDYFVRLYGPAGDVLREYGFRIRG